MCNLLVINSLVYVKTVNNNNNNNNYVTIMPINKCITINMSSVDV